MYREIPMFRRTLYDPLGLPDAATVLADPEPSSFLQ